MPIPTGWGRLRDTLALEAILESASECILAVGRDGRILAANSRVSAMFGYEVAEAVGLCVEQLMPEGIRSAHQQHRVGYFHAPRVRPMGDGTELVALRKDGNQFPVEISLSFIEFEHERIAIAFVSDITGRKKLEEQLLQSQKMEAVGRLAGGIAHDFNNLLTVISGYDRFLLNQLSTLDSRRTHAEEILKAAERATALVRQLLAFSRRQMIRPEVIEVDSLIRASEPMMRRLMGEDVELVYHLAARGCRIKADPSQVEQVLMNLLVNARDAMPKGGTITVETAAVRLDEQYARSHAGVKPGPFFLLAVADNGNGMDTETRRHLFEPFFTTKPVGSGTGLGLATVYGIAKQHGGDVWVYSETGVGTTFKVYFPLCLHGTQLQETTAPVAAAAEPSGSSVILVVEDEAGVRHLLREILRQEGHRVLAAAGAEEAWEMSRAFLGDIHLLITDVVLPRHGGREVAERLVSERPGLQVLFMSGYTEKTVVDHGVLGTEIDFLQKPFSFEDVLAKVRRALSAS